MTLWGAVPRTERGFALLIVLWSIVLLAFLGSQLAAAGRGQAQLVVNLRTNAAVEAEADGAVYEALFHLLDTSSQRWQAGGAPRELRRFDTVINIRIASQAGKINPNTAQVPLLQGLLRAAGADQTSATSIAAAISDWRFPSADAHMLQAQYRAAGLPFGPPGTPIETISELRLVRGMTSELLARLAPDLSIYQTGEVDPRAATPAVLQALREASISFDDRAGIDDSVVEVSAEARGANHTRFIRRAVIRLGGSDKARPFQILAWH